MSTVYVGNLDSSATGKKKIISLKYCYKLEKDLRYEFDRYGKILDVWIARNPPGI